MEDHSSAASYINLVHHLIEKCLILRLSKEESMAALSEHANINPIITSTVWNELEKENKEFFKAYWHFQSKGIEMFPETEASQILQKLVSGNSNDDNV